MAITAEVLLINADYMKRYSHLNGSVEEAYIRPQIMLAQDKYVQSYLGTDLLNRLKDDVMNGTLAGVYDTLLNDYVRKMCLWWTMVEMIPHLYVRLDNGGLAIRTSEDTTPVSKADLDREMNLSRDNAQFYTERLIDYLCVNSTSFPEYTSNVSPDMKPERSTYYDSGLEISSNRR